MKYYNRKTRITASTIGILLGIAGIVNHGIFEILQGYTSTNGFFIEAIGEANRYWIHGTEAAFTVIHNFLITGIFAILAGLSLIIWTFRFIQRKYGAIVFLMLFILLTLVGGGIGYIILFVPTWLFSTRINKSLKWWKKLISARRRIMLSELWIYSLVTTSISWLILMELGIFGYFPGQDNPDVILDIVFGFLFASGILACITFVCALAADITSREPNENIP